MFNLGYLPGSNKVRTTRCTTTGKAVEDAIELLVPGGGLLIAVYPGHQEGYLEGQMLSEMFADVAGTAFRLQPFCLQRFGIPDHQFAGIALFLLGGALGTALTPEKQTEGIFYENTSFR